ncbi:DNA polymerase epsilon subunit b [Anaeramoeba flamelloides]|uniref:DNA polymerase epsilon subunit n=1 Tax=Anaeramoeba flamelloides TaxID=1746091 RepID=A0ABQ8YCW6_9EUKA|nr:DNA polymerase epsilon subunit b [Anaeramoeba flamelloides]
MSKIKFRRTVIGQFKYQGFSVRPNATELIIDVVTDESGKEIDLDLLSLLVTKICEKHGSENEMSRMVESDLVTKVLKEFLEEQEKQKSKIDSEEETIEIIDVFKQPKFSYKSSNIKSIIYSKDPKPNGFLGNSETKVSMFNERYEILLQRTLRNSLFSSKTSESSNEESSYSISSVISLLGDTKKRIILGMITQLEDEVFYIEDPSGWIKVNFETTKTANGIFTENSIVIAEGRCNNEDEFVVKTIGFPPPESREETIKHLEQDKRGLSLIDETLSEPWFLKLQEEEINDPDQQMIIISEIWLDKDSVFEKLEKLFTGFNIEEPPSVFLLIGNFFSTPFDGSTKQLEKRKNSFLRLRDLMINYDFICQHSKFIFVPGINDISYSPLLPRKCISNSLISMFRTTYKGSSQLTINKNFLSKNSYFVSNPCRIRFFTKEIVICREDLINKFLRHSIFPTPTKNSEIANSIAKTIIDQAYLFPFPLNIRPILWNFDYSLRLFPTPDTLILADKFEQYSGKYNNCNYCNPGCFSTDFSFVVHYPNTDEIQFSRIK